MTSQTLFISVPNPSLSLSLSLSLSQTSSLLALSQPHPWRLPLSHPYPRRLKTPSFMVEIHFFQYHLPLSSQINAMETFDKGFSSFTSPPLLLFHANSSDLVQNVLGLNFWVCISIFGFGSLFVFGFMCQMSKEYLTRPTSSATTIYDSNTGGHRSLSFFFWFGSLFVWVLVNLWIGFSYVI